MNRLTIIGNLTSDPEMRVTATGKNVCGFSVAVNRRGQDEVDFFRVSTWNQLAENCNKYLRKGRKVAVVGPVSVHMYTNSKGENKASMEVMANEVEFLSPSDTDKQSGYTKVDVEPPFDELPV